MPLSIWEHAAQKLKEPTKKFGSEVDGESKTGEDEIKQKEDSYAIIFGSKNSGKTSLLLRFLDRDEPPKPTIALEYTYGRRARGNNKDIGHLWELGGGPFLTNLLDVPLKVDNIEDSALILVLDLSQPEELWHTMETCVNAARKRIEKLYSEMKISNPDLMAYIQRKAWERIGIENPDKDFIKPFPIPLAILGGKFDIFQDFDSEKKKIICKTLRFFAHTNGASLQFFSTKMETLVTRGRALLSHLVFNTVPSKGLAVDYNKPLFVPVGSDSLKEIGAPPLEDKNLGTVHAANPNDLWKSAFCGHFPQKNTKMEIREDPANDPQYKEEAIDLLRAQKDQELERYIRQKGCDTDGPIDFHIPRPVQRQLIPAQKNLSGLSPRDSPRSPVPQKPVLSVAPTSQKPMTTAGSSGSQSPAEKSTGKDSGHSSPARSMLDQASPKTQSPLRSLNREPTDQSIKSKKSLSIRRDGTSPVGSLEPAEAALRAELEGSPRSVRREGSHKSMSSMKSGGSGHSGEAAPQSPARSLKPDETASPRSLQREGTAQSVRSLGGLKPDEKASPRSLQREGTAQSVRSSGGLKPDETASPRSLQREGTAQSVRSSGGQSTSQASPRSLKPESPSPSIKVSPRSMKGAESPGKPNENSSEDDLVKNDEDSDF